MPARFIGVDGEMTGTDGPAVHQLIQIGVATAPDEVFVSDIGYDKWSENPESMAVHGFSAERIRAAPRADAVDAELCGWLGDKVVGSGRGLIAVGWNVAAFDLPYVRQYLPRFSSHLSGRSVDLNAVHVRRDGGVEMEEPQEALEAVRRGTARLRAVARRGL
ncbi:MAG: hypothetical protein M3345_06540 [Actinomycetota bacterium]|nr:hypothetical protein [Actinomycetota bacterium]